MKKLLLLSLAFICSLALSSCGKNDTFMISITVPAGSDEGFVYSDEEICATGKRITLSCGDGLGDTEVILKPVSKNLSAEYNGVYITPGMPAKFDTDDGMWFKIGVAVINDTDTDKTVYVEASGVEVRIE